MRVSELLGEEISEAFLAALEAVEDSRRLVADVHCDEVDTDGWGAIGCCIDHALHVNPHTITVAELLARSAEVF